MTQATAQKSFLEKVAVFCEAIKVSHSVFALPFAVSSAFLAAGGLPALDLLGKIVLAVVLARTAAMAFNRWADARIDALNPRTQSRAVPRGLLSRRFFAVATAACAAGFVLTCAWIHDLALWLCPVVLLVLLGYSYTKRFTSASHLVLGAALGLSPVGAWVAVREEVSLTSVFLALAVLLWTAGFDVIYACQDHEFDHTHGLHSIPRRFGIRGGLLISRWLHAGAFALLVSLGFLERMGLPYTAGLLCVAGLLVYEHSLVKPHDLSRVNVAFFSLNGLVSLVFMGSVVLETLL